MKYEIKIMKVTPNGCCLVYSKEVESEKEMQEIVMYNKKIHCFLIKERIDNDLIERS